MAGSVLLGRLWVDGVMTGGAGLISSRDVRLRFKGPTPKGDVDIEVTTHLGPGYWMFMPMWAEEDIYSKLCDCKEPCDLHPTLMAKKDTLFIRTIRIA